MKIKEILEQDDGFALGSIDRCRIKKIGVTKNDADNCYQILFVEDQDGNELKVKLKYESHFLDKNTKLDADSIVQFECGPPIKNKNTGLIVFNRDNIFRVDVTAAATVKYGAQREEEQVKEEEPEDNPQLTEKDKEDLQEKQKESERINSELQQHPWEYNLHGPSDEEIKRNYYERLHIFRVLYQENMKQAANGPVYPIDGLMPMVTSFHIDLFKNGMKILPPKSTKPKFETIEKPHNPKQEETREEESSDPLDPKKAKEQLHNIIGSLRNHKVFNTPGIGKNGGSIGEQMLDDETRPKMIAWYLARTQEGFTDKQAKSKAAWTGIHYLLRSINASWESYILIEAMFTDAILDSDNYKNKDYHSLTEQECAGIETHISVKAFKESNKGNNKQLARDYFSLPEEERRIA